MFSGIISAITKVKNHEVKNGSLFMTIMKPEGWQIKEGDSIATNGVCLTVKEIYEDSYLTELMQETLKKTTFGVNVPQEVNVEQSLTLSSTLDGHLVFGHVDAIGTIKEVTPVDSSKVYKFSFPSEFTRLIAPKGSISVDGISLTVVDVGNDWFTVSLVDYTIQHTSLGKKEAGELVNLEFDMLAKYIDRILEVRSKQ